MTHTELINAAAKRAGVTQDQAADVLKAADAITLEKLQAGEEVHTGFGKLERSQWHATRRLDLPGTVALPG